jgi:uncharacterized protein YbjT (DUF2867 family)
MADKCHTKAKVMVSVMEEHTNNSTKTIILAGATGKLGQRIAWHLLQKGATVKALVRTNTSQPEVEWLRQQGATIIEADYSNTQLLRQACEGSSCVVSALSGLREVIVDAQTKLLHAAVEARVLRFIPSDFCIDYTKLPKGSNRNLDLRREFSERLDEEPIQATSIFNGMFTDLLTGQAPVILSGIKRVVYWGNADQQMDFTTMEDTAAYTAATALDEDTPRFLRIAGDVVDNNGLRNAASQAMGKEFKLLRAGSLNAFATMIRITRTLLPKKKEVFPAWQGMQYLHNMYTGLPKLAPLDNHRYPGLRWTSVKEVLKQKE